MIISHLYNFIFLKTFKTAGTSFEMFLGQFLTPIDVATPISPVDEFKRVKSGAFAQNYVMHTMDYGGEPISLVGIEKHRSGIRQVAALRNHLPARGLVDIVGRAVFDRYVKFTIERHPIEVAISLYHWKNRNGDLDTTLERYLLDYTPLDNASIYCINGETAVDFFLIYETLQQDVGDFCSAFGLKPEFGIPFAKSQHRQDKRPYTKCLSKDVISHLERSMSVQIARYEKATSLRVKDWSGWSKRSGD